MNPLKLIPTQYMLAAKLGVVAVAMAGSFVAGSTVTGWRADAKIAALKQAHAEDAEKAANTATKALNEAIERGNAAMKLAEEATNEARKNEQALAAAVAASKRDRRLRDAAKATLDRQLSACSVAAASGGQAGGVPADRSDGDRLLQLLSGLESAAGMHAEAAQRSRDKGLLAERLYEVNRQACQ